jgi:hypothetical protein
MMKLLLGTVAAFALSTAAQAQQATITTGSTTLLIPSANDFQSQLQGQGLSYFTAGPGSSISLTAPALLEFTYMGSESGFRDNFTATSLGGPIFKQENSTGLDNQWVGGGPGGGVLIGSGAFNAGSLFGLLTFNSLDAGALAAGIGSAGFGIFIPSAQSGGPLNPYSTNVFYIGYDDQATRPDDNHDDILIRVRVLAAVPEPATWAMMLLGFAGIGFAVRRSRKPGLAQLA